MSKMTDMKVGRDAIEHALPSPLYAVSQKRCTSKSNFSKAHLLTNSRCFKAFVFDGRLNWVQIHIIFMWCILATRFKFRKVQTDMWTAHPIFSRETGNKFHSIHPISASLKWASCICEAVNSNLNSQLIHSAVVFWSKYLSSSLVL